MSGLYEIHITTDTLDAEVASTVARANKWKTSEIARDPVLGNKNYFYLTKYADTLGEAQLEVLEIIAALRDAGVDPLRAKIEQIVFDQRFG